MTEREWLAATDPTLMLEFVRGKVSDRKVRLFACACCRNIWNLLHDALARNTVEVAERYADGLASDADLLTVAGNAPELAYAIVDSTTASVRCALRAAHLTAFAPHTINAYVVPPGLTRSTYSGYGSEAFTNLDGFAHMVCVFVANALLNSGTEWSGGYEPMLESEYERQAGVVRDIFNNPFRPASVDPSWLTSTVVQLAEGIYEDHAFDRFPILADALMDAGCDNDDILNHLRGDGPHCRGCWALDLILGKA